MRIGGNRLELAGSRTMFRRGLTRLRVVIVLLACGVGLLGGVSACGQSPKPAQVTADASAYHLPPEKLAKATVLGRLRVWMHFGEEFWGLAVVALFLASGTAGKLGARIPARTQRRWLQGLLFSMELVTIIFLFGQLPFAVVGHAVSLHYGISVQAWGSWLLDQAKLLGLTIALEVPLLMLVFGLMRWPWSRRFYWAWMALLMVPFTIIGTVLLPSVIEPMFDTFTPLAQTHPALVQQLERVVARTGTSIPAERMFLMDASDKSNGLNAYVTGLGPSKRIVVWDTTADRMPVDEILFTFAHESGHYVLNHIPKGLALGAVGMFFFFGATVWLAGWMVRRWGLAWRVESVTSLAGLAVVVLALTVMQVVTEPIENWTSRYAEHQADVYGQEAIHGIVADPQKTAVAAFNDLGAAYLDDPYPSPFIEFWTYDHPSIQTRAKLAAQYNPWTAGRTPEFFAK
jgi:STE24 endopeptidase